MLLEVATQLLLALGPLADRLEVEVVERHAPLEEQHEEHVDDRLREEARLPLLLGVDAHDLVADVLVLADDVRVRVVQVVVGVLPARGRRRGVPVPGRGVDVRVVHPVPLPVQDVVADLHVLEDLRHAQPGGPEQPRRRVARRHQHDPRQRGEAAMELDDAADVLGVVLAEARADLVVDRLERVADLLDLLRRQAVQRVVRVGRRVCAVDGWHQSSISTCPSGALTQVRTVSPDVAVHLAGPQVADLA